MSIKTLEKRISKLEKKICCIPTFDSVPATNKGAFVIVSDVLYFWNETVYQAV